MYVLFSSKAVTSLSAENVNRHVIKNMYSIHVLEEMAGSYQEIPSSPSLVDVTAVSPKFSFGRRKIERMKMETENTEKTTARALCGLRPSGGTKRYPLPARANRWLEREHVNAFTSMINCSTFV